MRRRNQLGMIAATSWSAACTSVRAFGVRATSGQWERRAGLGVPRDDFACAGAAGRLYAVGGMTGARGNALDSVEAFDPTTNVWTRMARLPAPVSSLRAATVHDRVYAVGGAREDEEVGSAWAYNVGAQRWDSTAPLILPRLGHGLAAYAGRLFAVGGLSRGEATAAVETYDPSRDAWISLAPLPAARFNLALVPFHNRLYAIGGSGPDRRPVRSVQIYHPEQDRWVRGPLLPEALSNFAAAAVDERRIHAVLHRYHFVLDARATTWASATPMPTSRHGLALEALAGELYAVGGCSEDPQRDLATVEVFRSRV